MELLKNTETTAILQGLHDSPAILSAFVESIPEEALYNKRGEGFWSIAEHVVHLAEVQPMGLERINRMLEEDTPEFIPYIPDEEQSADVASLPTMAQALSEFRSGRAVIVKRLSAATPDDWERMAIHPEYRQYGLHIFARHLLMHDHWHMYRMEELWLTRGNYITRL